MSKSTVSTTVPQEVKQRLDEEADSRNLTRSEIAREILVNGTTRIPWIKYQIQQNATVIAVIWIFAVLIGGFEWSTVFFTGLAVLGMQIYSYWIYGR
jgi:predicted transcriptional regulator